MLSRTFGGVEALRGLLAMPRFANLPSHWDALTVFAFFDEAGKFHDKDGRICLCGFLADDCCWEAFNKDWSALLKEWGFRAIHMSQFPSQCRARGWNEAHAQAVLTEFVDIIRRRVQFGFGVAVDGKYFRHKFQIAGKPTKDPKRFYTQRLLANLRGACADLGFPPHLNLTFDEDEEFAVDCYLIISRLRRERPEVRDLVVSIGFADDEYFTPLQAADVLASLTRDRLITGKTPDLLERLAQSEPSFILRFDGGELWDEAGIDKNWPLIESAGDMPSKMR